MTFRTQEQFSKPPSPPEPPKARKRVDIDGPLSFASLVVGMGVIAIVISNVF